MNLGLTAKTILPVLAILVFVMSFIAIFNYKSHIAIVNDMARESLDNALDLGQRRMGSQIRSDQQLPLLVSSLDEIRKIYEVEGGILVSKTAATAKNGNGRRHAHPVTEYAPHFSTLPNLSDSILKPDVFGKMSAASDRIHIDESVFSGRTYALAMARLKDYSGREIGILYVMKDRSAALKRIQKTLAINVTICAAILIFISAAISFILKKTVVNPVTALATTVNAISMGNLTQKVEVTTKDELAGLAKSIDRMRVSMKRLLE
ncbi:MAG TPA: HAMP domain-containing protein [Dissulfurispiraceae bacterium]|nr:HAMP domain-containing protein [Dissulfurispiraceae bacterium]